MAEHRACQDCGMSHAPDDKARCIEGHGDDPYPLIDRLDQGWLTTTDLAASSAPTEQVP